MRGRLFQRTAPLQSTTVLQSDSVRERTIAFFGREGRCDKIKEEAINVTLFLSPFFFHKTKNIVLCGLSLEPVHQFLPKSLI